jgi:hypothetical protein
LSAPNYTISIVDDSGRQTQEFNDWINQVNRSLIIVGAGSPEGVVTATIAQEYMDSAGTAGAIKYIKRDADIAGDLSKGWILI